MSAITPIELNPGTSAGGVGKAGGPKIDGQSPDSGVSSADGAQFRAALDRHTNGVGGPEPAKPDNKVSLGDRLAGRASDLASGMQKDQQYVSKMLEQATRTGDSMQLMKAMMALNDYQIRVQTISKTVSKATQGFEQLTKLQ